MRCSVCSYVFPVDPPPGAGEHPWQIRTVEDLLFTAPDLTTLRTWIAEGRLHPDDQVSRTGKHWLRLGDMPEFSSAFTGYEDLPQVFEELVPPSIGSALEELGPPPGFGETMPVVQGVDTDILVVRESQQDFEVPVTARSAAVERGHERSGPRPVAVLGSMTSETSGPEPFPLAELGVHDEPSARTPIDESAVRMRPRPPASSTPAVPHAIDDEPIEEVRRRSPKPTVRYGAEEVYGPEAGLDDDELPATSASSASASDSHGAAVRPSAAAVERPAGPTREPTGRVAAIEPEPAASRSRDDLDAIDDDLERRRRRRREVDLDDDEPRRRSSWPLVAALGTLAAVAVVFGVPGIRAKVLGLAGDVTEPDAPAFDPASLAELEHARVAMINLDPVEVGRAEAALQGRLDEGTASAAGEAEMKLAQVELLATRALEHEIGLAAGAPPSEGPVDDVERASQILVSLDGGDVVDRAHMRRVRAMLRLAQGRAAAEILPLLPEDGSGEVRQLVEASPLWRDPEAAVPEGVIEGLEGLADKSALAELALALAYLRAGDDARALAVAKAVLARVPAQPTALAVQARAGGGPGPVDDGKAPKDGKGDGKAPADTKSDPPDAEAGDGKAPADDTKDDGKPKPAKTESVDSLIDRGCRLVESGDASGALDALRKAKARGSNDLDLLVCMGQAHAKQGHARDALTSFEAALSKSPRYAAALAGAARASDKLGDTSGAVGYYRRLLAERPGDSKALAYVQEHG